MAENNVTFNIFANSSQFQREMKDAVESAKNVQRGLKDIGIGIGGALGVGAIVSGFKSLVDYAMEARDAAAEIGKRVDSGTESVAKLGDAFAAAKKGAMELGVFILSLYTRAGELIGTTIAELKEGLSLDQVERIQATYDALAETEKRLAEAREKNSPEKLEESEKKLAQTRQEELIKRADGEAKVTELLKQQNQLRADLANLGKNTVAYQEKAAELEKNITETQLAARDMQKSKLEELKKATDERQNKEKEFAKDQFAAQERLAKARFEALAPEQQIEELLKRQAALQNMILQSKKLGLSTLDDEADLQENVNQLAAIQAKIAEDQLRAEREKTAEIQKQQEVGGMRWRTSENFKDASDKELAELVRRNRQQAVDVQNLPRFGTDRIWNQLEVTRLNGEAENAQKELDFRNALRFQISSMGVDFARTQFRGDPLLFDNIVQKYVQDSRDVLATNKQAVDRLQDLNDRLAKIGLNK